jgi:hypothetical protein
MSKDIILVGKIVSISVAIYNGIVNIIKALFSLLSSTNYHQIHLLKTVPWVSNVSFASNDYQIVAKHHSVIFYLEKILFMGNDFFATQLSHQQKLKSSTKEEWNCKNKQFKYEIKKDESRFCQTLNEVDNKKLNTYSNSKTQTHQNGIESNIMTHVKYLSTNETQLMLSLSSLQQLEERMLTKNPWYLRGENYSYERPINSALDFETYITHHENSYHQPSENDSVVLENIIRKRIQERRYDNVDIGENFFHKKRIRSNIINHVKPSIVHNELQKEAFQRQFETRKGLLTNTSSDLFGNEKHAKATLMYQTLCRSLCKLSH